MNQKHAHKSDGQALIQVALAMMFLLLIVSVAVDVGHLYAERRRMQNAADAGALAGARELCLLKGQQAAENAAQTYATTKNGADDADVSFPADGKGWWVKVVANESADLFLGGVVGFPSADVNAEATAACGAVSRACGFMPVGWPEGQWAKMYHSGCGPDHWFIMIEGPVSCGPLPGDVNCDLDGDGIDEMAVLGTAYNVQGYLNLPVPDPNLYPSPCDNCTGGAKYLTCLVGNGYAGVIPLPSCVHTKTGVTTSVMMEIGNRVGDSLGFPLFDRLCGQPGDPPVISCGGSGDVAHLSSVACATIVKYHQQYVFHLNNGTTGKSKAVEAYVSCDQSCFESCGATGGGEPRPGDAWAVSLLP